VARIYRRGAGWHVDYRDALGLRVRRRVASERSTATRILAELVRDAELGRVGLAPVSTRRTLLEPIRAQYLAFLEGSGRKPRTVRLARVGTAAVMAGCRLVFLGDVTLERVDGYARERTLGGAMAGTVNLELKALRRMFTWAVRRGLVREDPLRFMEYVRGERRERGVLEDLEVGALLDAAGRMRPVWSTFLLAGLRSGELCGLDWEAVDLGLGVIVVRGKTTRRGDPGDHLPIGAELGRVLGDLSRATGRTFGAVFLNAEGRRFTGDRLRFLLKRDLRRIGVDARSRGLDVHGLRRTYGTMLAAEPANDVRTVMALMRHRKIATTMELYARPRAIRLRDAADRVGTIVARKGARDAEIEPGWRVG